MPVLLHINSLLHNLFCRERIEKDLDNEIRSHLELLTDEKISEGMDREEATRAARIELGGIEQVKESVRAVRAGVWLATVSQDFGFAVRMLRKTPGFTLTAIAALTLGIGANVAIFSVVNTVILKPLRAPDPDRIVQIEQEFEGFPPSSGTGLQSSICGKSRQIFLRTCLLIGWIA